MNNNIKSLISSINQQTAPSPADRNARIDELSARLESRIAKRTSDLFHRMRPRKGSNSETARAEFDRVSDSRKQDTPTDPSHYQLTNNHNLHSDLVSLEHDSFDSDPSLVPTEIANNSFSHGNHSRFIERILPNQQSPTKRNGVNDHEQRNNESSTSHAGAFGAKARASFRGVTNAIIGYIDNFEFEQKRVLDYLTRQSEQRDQAISSYDTELNNLRKSLGLPHRETLINI